MVSGHHSVRAGDFLTLELGHFGLPNERCDHVNLVSAAPSWHVPYSITYLSQMSNKHALSRFETPVLGSLVCLPSSTVSDIVPRMVTFSLLNWVYFDLPNQLCGCIPGPGAYERCDHVNLVSAAPSWRIPNLTTFRDIAR